MLKMVDGTGIIGVDMVCPLGGTVSPPQPPNYDRVELEGQGCWYFRTAWMRRWRGWSWVGRRSRCRLQEEFA